MPPIAAPPLPSTPRFVPGSATRSVEEPATRPVAPPAARPVAPPTARSVARRGAPQVAPSAAQCSTPRKPVRPPRSRSARRARCGLLGGYADPDGRSREIVALAARAGSVLVVDRDAHTLRDRRLLAHLAADEPTENAALVCRLYLLDRRRGRTRCRALQPADLGAPDPFHAAPTDAAAPTVTPSPVDRHGRAYRLGLLSSRLSIPELRWLALEPDPRSDAGVGHAGIWQPISFRDIVGGLESYEPARSRTVAALARHREDPAISVSVLRGELRRLDASRIVLNRALRGAVLRALEQNDDLSLSEIAARCGRVKRDVRGHASGETTWLARRVGISPEAGESQPTPWIHSDVLALIARNGLGISPHEVELG
jgi:hypothetical protein